MNGALCCETMSEITSEGVLWSIVTGIALIVQQTKNKNIQLAKIIAVPAKALPLAELNLENVAVLALQLCFNAKRP